VSCAVQTAADFCYCDRGNYRIYRFKTNIVNSSLSTSQYTHHLFIRCL